MLQEILFRKGIREEDRRRALVDLAKQSGQPEPKTLIDALRDRDTRNLTRARAR